MNKKENKKNHHYSTRRIVIATEISFGLVIVLLFSMLALSLTEVRQLNQRLENLMSETTYKMEHFYSLRILARERVLSLHQMLAADDPFIEDDEWMRHQDLASQFLQAQEILEQLAWDQEEKHLLAELIAATRFSQPVQQSVVMLIQQGNHELAYKNLLRAQDMQEPVFSVLDKLLEIQRRHQQSDLASATREYEDAIDFMLFFGVASGLMILAASAFVRRTVFRQAGELEEKSYQLEKNNIALEQANQQVVATSQMKSEFLANMSHEIRTPLTAIRGSIALLAGGALGVLPEKIQGVMQVAHRNTERLLFLLNDILDFSKIEAGKLVIDTQPMLLRGECDAVLELFTLPCREKGLSLQLELGSTETVVLADPDRVRQVLVNLVGNAIKFTAKGSVTLRVSSLSLVAGEFCRIAVVDTGIGIDDKQCANLFAAFVQLDGASNRKFGGAGLGLTICQRLVQAMAGDIGVNSQVGKGSEFYFTLPLVAGVVQGARLEVVGS